MGSNPEIIFLNIYFFKKNKRWLQARAMWKLKSMMAVSSKHIGHHTISGNISLFQICQKLKKVVQRLQVCYAYELKMFAWDNEDV